MSVNYWYYIINICFRNLWEWNWDVKQETIKTIHSQSTCIIMSCLCHALGLVLGIWEQVRWTYPCLHRVYNQSGKGWKRRYSKGIKLVIIKNMVWVCAALIKKCKAATQKSETFFSVETRSLLNSVSWGWDSTVYLLCMQN